MKTPQEKTLSRLQDNVSEEEQKWKTQLNEKQIEVDNLKQSIVQVIVFSGKYKFYFY